MYCLAQYCILSSDTSRLRPVVQTARDIFADSPSHGGTIECGARDCVPCSEPSREIVADLRRATLLHLIAFHAEHTWPTA